MRPPSLLLSLALLTFPAVPAYPAGKELEGVRAAAKTACPTPEEARAQMTVPEGYEVRCFAHEPMVVNPVAMTWDHRGRLWVVEAYEYPEGTPLPIEKRPFGGEAKDSAYHPFPKQCLGDAKPDGLPRDRVIILEDTDNDGVADKRTVFVQGLNLASAIICGDNGIYVGQQPHLIHFLDADGDDKPEAWRVCLTGFGREDTHELVNSFTWGPDGWLSMTHGVFTHSKVHRPGQAESEGFKFDAGIGRARPQSRATKDADWEFEVFADGTSNPWGCDYDAAGNFFVSACVIDHFFHMAPGGIYVRQGGAPENPYSYELLPSIVKHKHFRAAYAGIQIYQGGRYPKDTWGHAFIGNIHDNAVHEEILAPTGATFTCEPRRDFLRANNGWFRPVSTQTGPDGFLWIMDWCDKYPCYQNAKANPEGVDRDRGRIWRVVTKDENSKGSRLQAGLDLEKLATADLVKTLGEPNNWSRRIARRMLVERRDDTAQKLLKNSVAAAPDAAALIEVLWTLHQCRLPETTLLDDLITHPQPAVRANIARISGERFRLAAQHLADVSDADPLKASAQERAASDLAMDELRRIEALEKDPDITVRSAVATALRMVASAALTTDRPLASESKHWRPVFKPWNAIHPLMEASAKSYDPLLQFQMWMVLEPGLAFDPESVLFDGANSNAAEMAKMQPLSLPLTAKTMRRLCDTQIRENLDLAVRYCDTLAPYGQLLSAALGGLVKGQENGVIKPRKDVSSSLTKWRTHTDAGIRASAQTLAMIWGDEAAIKEMIALLHEVKTPDSQRISILQSLRKVHSDLVKEGIKPLLTPQASPSLSIAAIRAATDLGGDDLINPLLGLAAAKDFGVRSAAFEALASRDAWTTAMLAAIKAGQVSADGFPAPVRRQLARSDKNAIRDEARRVLGVWKDSDEDVKALIAAKRKVCIEGEPDLANGKLMFTATCMVCHELHGQGQKVGPDLTGSGRSNLDALLSNVIDPNQIIGNGYENIVVTTKDGRTLSGRMTEDTPNHIKLLAAGGAVQVVPRDQVAKLENTHQSLMPMGFGNLPEAAFRDLIWYVLSPPEEGPLTQEKKALLIQGVDGGELAKRNQAAAAPRAAIDWESVSLWNPAWKISAPEFEGTPVKLATYQGRVNVLQVHPFPDKKTPAAFEQKFKVEPGKTQLTFAVAAHERGDWEMRVMVNGQTAKKLAVDHGEPRWKKVAVDLNPWLGQEVTVRLESHATGWSYEFAYWHGIELK